MSKQNKSQALNILHILRAPVGGLFRHVQDLALEQVARGHRVGLLADKNSCDGLTQKRLDDLKEHLMLGVHLSPMARVPSFHDLAVIRDVRQLVNKLDIDVLHGHGAKGGLYARLGGLNLFGSSFRTKIPKRFYTPHGGSLHFTDRFVLGLVYMGMENVLQRFTDGLIFESRFARRAYEEGLGRPRSETRIIANGLRKSDFDKINTDERDYEFLFVGELRHLKGVDLLLTALSRMDVTPAPRMLIVGDGPDRETFENLSRDLGLQDRVKFAGVMTAKRAFSMGKILVVPSRAESLPYVVLEAAAAGLPLIATRVGGVPEIVWGTDTQLITPDNVDALSAAMKSAIKDLETTQARARRLRDSVAKRFTVSSMTSSVLAFYEDALHANAQAS